MQSKKQIFKRKIAVMTSGGDAPGMNTAIRAIIKSAQKYDFEVYGVRRGYAGLVSNDIFKMEPSDAGGIIGVGGTVLLTARCSEFKEEKVREKAAKNLKKLGIDGLIVIGGDGSFRGADLLFREHCIKTIGVPGTIDNDISGTDTTIGFDTALNTIVEAVSKIRDTATSHERTYIIEVMGRNAGFLALYSCMCSGGDGLLIPEKEYNVNQMARHINKRYKNGKLHDIIIIAEGVEKAEKFAEELKPKITVKEQNETRVTILGHVQRGGSPTARDRILATKLGCYAVEMLNEDQGGIMVGVVSDRLETSPISHAWKYKKKISEKDYEITMLLSN